MNTHSLSEKPDDTVQSVLTLALAAYGVKRGIARAAELLGVSERWCRSLRFGEPARINAATYLRALEARQALAAERAAQIRAELASLDQIARIKPDDCTEATSGVGRLAGGGSFDVDRRDAHRGGGLDHQPA